MPLRFDNTYARLPERFFEHRQPTPVPAPAWLARNEPLAAELGLDPAEWDTPDLLAALAGNELLPGSEPIALAYAGHQFGNFVSSLGDGRALLLGEVVGTDGLRRDVALKGSGRTRFSRGGDGRAALGPVLREFLVSEAMHALGVPTTRSLAAVLTGDQVHRDGFKPGAVLTRVAASHLRVGTFEFFAARNDREALAMLVDQALARHVPDWDRAEPPAIALIDATVRSQSALVAKWLALGFVHGVMNTDNCAISGETLDYGPCAFLDVYDPGRTFSSIDTHGRYAFANQPAVALWNVARLADALVPLVGPRDDATIARLNERLSRFADRFTTEFTSLLRAKLGFVEERADDAALAQELLDAMAADRVDFTTAWRNLADAIDDDAPSFVDLFQTKDRVLDWLSSWRRRGLAEARAIETRRDQMRRASPAFIPRNHRVEEALAAAEVGDLAPFERLRHVLARPYDDHPDHADLASGPEVDDASYRTFCGT